MNYPFIKTTRLMLRPIIAGESKEMYSGLAGKDRNSVVRFYGVEFHTSV